MIRFSPDTCDCIIIFEHKTIKYSDYEQKCFIHKDFSNQNLLDQVFTHNNSIKLKLNPTEIDQADFAKSRANEKRRIGLLGPPSKNPNTGKGPPEP